MALLSSFLDFSKICRLCLSHDRPLTEIFPEQNQCTSSTSSKILSCVSIKVEFGATFPDKICNRCTEQLDNWCNFKELCDNANLLLLQFVAGTQPIAEEILQSSARGSNDEPLDLPDTSLDFSFVDVNSLDQDSLFLKLNPRGSLTPFVKGPPASCDGSGRNSSQNVVEKEEDEAELKTQKHREKHARVYMRKYNCDFCPKVFTKFFSLLQHDRVDHNSITPEQMCSKCNKLFISKKRLEVHNHLRHKEKIHECDVCDHKSVSQKALRLHKVKHSERFSCGVCGTAASTLSGLTSHEKTHNPKIECACEVCPKTFKQQTSLWNHTKLLRKSQYDFKCDVCSKLFKTRSNLKNHKDSHFGGKSFVCEICGLSLTSYNLLYKHRLSHGEKKHMCQVCNKVFHLKNLLTRHLQVHNSSDGFKCWVCDRVFNRQDTLDLHMNTHNSSEKNLSCEFCGKRFSLNRYLSRHLLRMHNKKDN